MKELSTAALVLRLYDIVEELEQRYTGLHFTPDGHLVGSLGEALAAEMFGLRLVTASNEGFDAVAPDGTTVQIKATQIGGVALQAIGLKADVLLVVVIDKNDGTFRIAYNGPYLPVFEAAGKAAKNGQRRISLSRLQAIQAQVPLALKPVR